MIFHKFPSIENTYRERSVNAVTHMGMANKEWIATLKIHGANFSFHTDNTKQVRCASKTGFIPLDQSFYHHEIILAKYMSGVRELYDMLCRVYGEEIESMGVYGEIFGGSYPHPDVPRNNKAPRIMKGVYYTPDIDFYMFALNVNGEWMDYDFATASSFYLKCPSTYELGRGTFQEMLEIQNDGPDPMYEWYDLPPIEGNTMEGVVIQPQEFFTLPNGKAAIFKNKNERFREKAHKSDRVKEPVVHPQIVLDQIDELCLYVTDNRLNNVLSHHGTVGEKEFGKILGAFSKDAYNDYLEDNEESYRLLTKIEQKIVRKAGQRECADLLRPTFMKISE